MSTTLHALGVTSVNVVGAMLEFLAAQPASSSRRVSVTGPVDPAGKVARDRSTHSRAERLIIANAAHLANLEQPDAVTNQILGHVTRKEVRDESR